MKKKKKLRPWMELPALVSKLSRALKKTIGALATNFVKNLFLFKFYFAFNLIY